MFKVLGKAAVCCALAALGASAAASAADWPQYLGPKRDGVAHDAKGLARAWPEGGPKKLWDTAVGEGYGGAAIYGDSVFLLDRVDDTGDLLRRFSLADGTEAWKYAYDARGKFDHNGGRSTPATDGQFVYSIGPLGHISAVKFSDGSFVWKGNLLTDWDAKLPEWASATSPLLYGDWVIVAPWGKKAALVAYEKATGHVVWTTPNPKGVALEYQSPVTMTLGGRDMVLATGHQGYLIGVDAKTGKQLFDYDGFPKKGSNIPSPVVIGDGRIFITGGYGAGGAMIQVEPEGTGYKVAELWKNGNMGSKCAQALLWKGFIYGNSFDDNGRGLRCLTLDGQAKWDSKDSTGKNFNLGYLIIADGLIYIIDGANGDLYMAEATPDGYKPLGKASFLRPPEPWAPLAFKDGKLVIRDMHKMVCLDVTAAK